MTQSTLVNHSDTVWDGVVLAGGRSSRMGQDKAHLSWHGQPLFLHMAAVLKEAGAARTMINRIGDGGDWVRDVIPGRGPLSGIHAALAESKAQALVIVPVDMPLLQPEHIQTLVKNFEGDYPVEFTGYSLPLLLPVNDHVRAVVETAIASEDHRDYALWRLVEKLDGLRVKEPEDHERAFANANTPAEWQACQLEEA
ncbi:molybdenum cofactor guanylyltransferase [Parendozoicomonas haliclonae]|uniref:Molybdenum cofactor guanylyltransferase n=1 Tax=Parendozoicomonas haliclonae TaxID=1960125 RepID=A0A1X7AI03_9GAMM|nr:molybdenum cofactor guanylyltransferase [Parendozoicomonas haliclonae]SMA37698.1 Molybdenum cofactor guanylyltransferase [Parendozoicomonas haliclonae]